MSQQIEFILQVSYECWIKFEISEPIPRTTVNSAQVKFVCCIQQPFQVIEVTSLYELFSK